MDTLSIAFLKQYLLDQFGATLISFVCEDTLLYANYLPDFANNKNDQMTISELFEIANNANGKGNNAQNFKKKRDIATDPQLKKKKNMYMELKVYCEDNSTSDEGLEVRLPTIKIPYNAS